MKCRALLLACAALLAGHGLFAQTSAPASDIKPRKVQFTGEPLTVKTAFEKLQQQTGFQITPRDTALLERNASFDAGELTQWEAFIGVVTRADPSPQTQWNIRRAGTDRGIGLRGRMFSN